MAGSGTTMMQEAEETTRRLMARVTDFLCAHHLPPSPANYAFAYQLVSNPDGMLARAVATIADGGVRLTQADLDRIGGPGAADADAARQVAHNQALVARTHDQVLGFETMVREIRDETGQFGDDLAAGAAAMRNAGSVRIDEVVEIAGAMVNRVRSAERRLAAATSEASELRQKLQEARDNARRDPLTALPNRRALEESYTTAAASREAMCFAVCDIDSFKSFNDTFGHLVGDRVLKAIADLLADHCAGHLVARYGGEEFAVLFSGIALDEALALLDRARAAVAGKRYRLRETNAPLGAITFSAGVTAAAPGEPLTDVFERADRLLYAAKADGRNCLKAG
ncbi:GGDEF domain-containing protein [Hephaestia mangrovi]|uniref:GGDEF domain-containing protein n=1 Tax=Hephaestia mangrovi TaxID=2873268 RepID=UPI002103EE44|nr:GGDEF domain-containing protein [Hephaestia mangrovi]